MRFPQSKAKAISQAPQGAEILGMCHRERRLPFWNAWKRPFSPFPGSSMNFYFLSAWSVRPLLSLLLFLWMTLCVFTRCACWSVPADHRGRHESPRSSRVGLLIPACLCPDSWRLLGFQTSAGWDSKAGVSSWESWLTLGEGRRCSPCKWSMIYGCGGEWLSAQHSARPRQMHNLPSRSQKTECWLCFLSLSWLKTSAEWWMRWFTLVGIPLIGF